MATQAHLLSSHLLASHSSAKLDAGQVRMQNQRLLLNIIWSEQTISRAELARRTGLSRSTVSAIVAEVMDTGLVTFRGAGLSQGGRRPVMLGFEDDALALVGVDVGASHVGVAVTDLRARARSWIYQPFEVRDDPEGTMALVEELVRDGLRRAGCATGSLAGIGVGVPSPVHPERPDQLSPLVLPRWEGISIPARLSETFGCRTLVDNDANLGALAEFWWGAGRGVSEIAFVKVGTGIGSGHIIRGEIYRGAGGVAGEIGHVVVAADGPECVCGLNGCLATLAGADAIVARVREALDDGAASPLASQGLTLSAIVSAAQAGDPLATRVIRRAGRHLGIAVAGLMNLLNPSTVVLGGGLMRAGELVLEPLRSALRKRTLWVSLDDASVVAGELGEQAVAIGAATLVLKTALDDPALFQAALGAP